VFIETMWKSQLFLCLRKDLIDQIAANVLVYSNGGQSLLVDTQLPPLALLTRSKVEATAGSPIDRAFITHWHPDHGGGIAAFSDDTEVLSHRPVSKRLSTRQAGTGA
jgi:glyoxylase-like metal-dependent hydrolase (beta-lactamase superfamily II)